MADYYTAASDPANDSDLDSSVIRAEWTALAAGFAKIAGYTGNGGKVLAINAGGTAMEALTTTGTGSGVRATSPTLVTPVLGVATATSINKITLTQPATGATLTLTDGKTLAATNTLTLSGTDGTTMTFPTTSATLARTDAANTFTGVQSMTSPAITTSITTPSTTFAVFNDTATTINAFGAASVALNIGHASAAAAFPGGISIPTGKTLSGAGAINISGAITGAAGSFTTGVFSGSISANGGIASVAAINVVLPASTTAHVFQTGNATHGWKWIQDESTTGDLYWQRRIASVDTTAVTFHRATGKVTFAAGMDGVLGGTTPAAATVTTLTASTSVTSGVFTGISTGNTTFFTATVDGSDNRAIQISSAGAYGPTRGGGIQVYGNESGGAGKVYIDAGNVSGGQILLRTGNNATAMTIDESQNVVLSAALILNATATPTGGGAGSVGQIAWDTSYLYVCTATNDWRRVALADF